MDKIKLLMKLGLTEYEGRAYMSLAKLGISTVREIVQDSKLPRNKTYEALQKLEDKNKVISYPLSPKKYKINDPEFFLNEINEMNSGINELIELSKNPINQEFEEMFLVIKGQKNIHEKLALNNSKLKKELLGCFNLSKIKYQNFKGIKDAIKRGVKVKFICIFDKKHIESYKMYLGIGAEIKIFNEKLFGPLLPRMAIFDERKSMLIIGKPEVRYSKDYVMLWTESIAFAGMQKRQFLDMWKKCKKIEGYL